MQKINLPRDATQAPLLLITGHGGGAANEAAIQMVKRIALDDTDGRRRWLAVLQAVMKIQAATKGQTLH